MTALHTDGPHHPDYTRDVADTLAQAARVLAHATRGTDGLHNPADAYDLAGTLARACHSLEQAFRQTGEFLEGQAAGGHLREDSGADPVEVAGEGADGLASSADAAGELARRLAKTQQIIGGLAASR